MSETSSLIGAVEGCQTCDPSDWENGGVGEWGSPLPFSHSPILPSPLPALAAASKSGYTLRLNDIFAAFR